MKIKVDTAILDYEDQPIKDGESNLTWKKVIYESLNSMMAGEVQTAEDKNKCYQITTKCYKSKEPDLTVEERAFVLERIKRIYNPLVCGRAEEFLDKPEKE